MHIYPRVRESERENESDAQCTHCNLAGKPFSAFSSSSSSPYASFPLLYFDKLVKQSSADSTSSSSGLACLIIIIISIGIGIGFGFGIAIANVSISINVRFAAPFCIETCNQNFQIFSPCVCVCVQWAGGLATVCPAQTDTHAPSELQSAHNSTKNAVQFLNCEPAPAPAQTVTHYPWHCLASTANPVSLYRCGSCSCSHPTWWNALGKLVHFGPKNNMFSKAAFPFMLHVVHTFPQMQRSCLTIPTYTPASSPPHLSTLSPCSTRSVKATPTPTSATPFAHICTCSCTVWISAIALRFTSASSIQPYSATSPNSLAIPFRGSFIAA